MKFIIKLALTTLAVLGLAHFLDGISVSPIETAVWVAIVIALLNTLLRPLLVLLTIPITILTLGLFLLVINACMVLLADKLIDGFHVENFWWAMGFSILLSVTQGILYRLFGVKGRSRKSKKKS